MSLFDLKPGQSALIDYITGDNKLGRRLLALGCIEGTPVRMINSAPFGDPVMISIRGFNLAIRKNDAKNIAIKESV